jgi:predicted nuclease of predicted toxin-antitoxin system
LRLWFDEDLSPTLVAVANERGFLATCNRDRGVLGISDRELLLLVEREDFVLVTDNAVDFRRLYGRTFPHAGVVVLPGSVPRARQRELARSGIDWIVAQAAAAGEEPAD